MAIKARYDAKEDRMLLILEGNKEGAERRSFWVTRRQWLGLYANLGPLKPEKAAATKQPGPKPQALPESLTSGAVAVEGIKVRKNEGMVQVAFMQDGKPFGVQVKDGEPLEQLKRMLEQQADRAGWDAPAAVQRMKAAAQANAAVKKASKG